jgi:hypothetical protein
MSDDEVKSIVDEPKEGEIKEDAPLSDEILHAFEGAPAAEEVPGADDDVPLAYHPSKDGEDSGDFDLGDEE